MTSMPKLSALATSLSLVIYASWANANEVTPKYTIEFAQPVSTSAATQSASMGSASTPSPTSATQGSVQPAASSMQPAQTPAQVAPMGALNTKTTSAMNFGESLTGSSTGNIASSNASATTMYDMPQAAAPAGANSSYQAAAPSYQPAAQGALDRANLERQAQTSPLQGQNQYPLSSSQSPMQHGQQSQAVPKTSTYDAQTVYEVEVVESPYHQQPNLAVNQGTQGQAGVYTQEAFNQGSVTTGPSVSPQTASATANGTNSTRAQATNNSPSFTFETTSEQTAAKPSNVFPLGSHAITTPDGRQIMVGPDGTPLLDSNGQQIPAPLEQIQEVSVVMLTSLDSALINAFKSLESGLTLGLGQNNHEYTLDDIAPALRGYAFDEAGNLLVRFSVNSAESIIKRHGSLSWNGLSNPILVWMVGLDEVNHSNKLSLVSGQNLSTFAQAIFNAAPDYKYRLMFPILDLEDMQKVKVSTVLNHQDDVLAQATQRYGSDYFISAAIDNVNDDGTGVALKWNLYNKKGELIAQSSLSGLVEEVASLGANDIARAVMTYQEEQRKNPEAKPEDNEPSELNANNVDINRLGAGDGFIRIRVENVRALSDFQEMRKAFVTYGYDGDIRIVGYDNGAMILELVTNSDIVHLEGTLRRAGDFKYLAPWTYRFNSTAAPRRSMQDPNFSSNSPSQHNYATQPQKPQNMMPQTANTEYVPIIRNAY